MSVPEGTGAGTNTSAAPSLFASLRSFWSVLLAVLYTRLDLVTAELQDEGIRALKLIVAVEQFLTPTLEVPPIVETLVRVKQSHSDDNPMVRNLMFGAHEDCSGCVISINQINSK